MTFEDILWNYGLIENWTDYLEKLSIYVLDYNWTPINRDKFFFVTNIFQL